MEKVTLGEEEPQLHGTRRWPAFCQPLCPDSSLYPRYSVGFWALSSGLYYGLLSRRLTGRAAWGGAGLAGLQVLWLSLPCKSCTGGESKHWRLELASPKPEPRLQPTAANCPSAPYGKA